MGYLARGLPVSILATVTPLGITVTWASTAGRPEYSGMIPYTPTGGPTVRSNSWSEEILCSRPSQYCCSRDWRKKRRYWKDGGNFTSKIVLRKSSGEKRKGETYEINVSVAVLPYLDT